jgi:hypothetical protein
MDNVQSQLTRIEKKINIIGNLVITISNAFLIIIAAHIITKEVQTRWNFVIVMVLIFLSSACTIYMSIKFEEAGKSRA